MKRLTKLVIARLIATALWGFGLGANVTVIEYGTLEWFTVLGGSMTCVWMAHWCGGLDRDIDNEKRNRGLRGVTKP